MHRYRVRMEQAIKLPFNPETDKVTMELSCSIHDDWQELRASPAYTDNGESVISGVFWPVTRSIFRYNAYRMDAITRDAVSAHISTSVVVDIIAGYENDRSDVSGLQWKYTERDGIAGLYSDARTARALRMTESEVLDFQFNVKLR